MTSDTVKEAMDGVSLSLHENNFDYIRLFAATQVVIFHTLFHLRIEQPLWTVLFRPFSGVPIFFLVSGFLITASYERSSSFKSYVEKRLRRIYPGLWFCILVTSGVVLALGYDLASKQGLVWFSAQLFGIIYTPKFLSGFGFGSYNGSLWTIPVELQFYATVPLLSVLMSRTSNRKATILGVLAVSMVVGVLIRMVFPSVMGSYEGNESSAAKLVRYSFFSHYFQFCLGAAAFYLSLHSAKWIKGCAPFWLVLVLVADWAIPASSIGIIAKQMVLGLFTLSAAFTFVRPSRLRGFDISYGIYLFHGRAINLIIAMGMADAPAVLYIVLLVSYCAGAVSWWFVESRFVAGKKQRIAVMPRHIEAGAR